MQKAGNVIAGILGVFILICILAALIARSASPPASALPPLPTKFIIVLASALAWLVWSVAGRLGTWAFWLLQKRLGPKAQGDEARGSNLIGFGIVVLTMLTLRNPLAVFGVHGSDAQRLTLWYEIFLAIVAVIMLANALTSPKASKKLSRHRPK